MALCASPLPGAEEVFPGDSRARIPAALSLRDERLLLVDRLAGIGFIALIISVMVMIGLLYIN